MVTFGLPEFTKLAIQSIRETVKNPFKIFVVVGKPGDTETLALLAEQQTKYEDISWITHIENKGFPASINDIYDYAWKENNYDNLILMGNDVILYPTSGDSLIDLANTSDYKVISALQYDVRDLNKEFPEVRQYFQGEDYLFTDFTSRPWDVFKKYSSEPEIADMQMFDIQNLCLYKKEVFDKVGYTDVNFYPAYFVDNDYARRIVIANIRCCSMVNARFFHFWSRVMKQGEGGSTNSYFTRNQVYYKQKWGGDFGKETRIPEIKIHSREDEKLTIEYWR
jgi:GT2 family glycosyltransferase